MIKPLGVNKRVCDETIILKKHTNIWVRSQNCGCLVTWFCYQLIAKPGIKTATVSWPHPYLHSVSFLMMVNLQMHRCFTQPQWVKMIICSQHWTYWWTSTATCLDICRHMDDQVWIHSDNYRTSTPMVKMLTIDLLHKSHNTPVLDPTMHHFVTEMCTCVHISVTKWCIVGYLSNALWGLWDGTINTPYGSSPMRVRFASFHVNVSSQTVPLTSSWFITPILQLVSLCQPTSHWLPYAHSVSICLMLSV